MFTALPIIYFAIYDKEYERTELLENPIFYQKSRKGCYFNIMVFWRWMSYGAFQGTMIFLVVLYSIATVSTYYNGVMEDFYFFGNLVFTLVILVVSLKLLIEFNLHTWASTLVICASLFVYYMFYYILSLIRSSTIYGCFRRLFFNITVFAVQFVLISIILFMDLVMARARALMYEYMQVAKGTAPYHIKSGGVKPEPSISI